MTHSAHPSCYTPGQLGKENHSPGLSPFSLLEEDLQEAEAQWTSPPNPTPHGREDFVEQLQVRNTNFEKWVSAAQSGHEAMDTAQESRPRFVLREVLAKAELEF